MLNNGVAGLTLRGEMAGCAYGGRPGTRGAAPADPDAARMLRVKIGDEAAFSELFLKYAPRILQFVRRFTASQARAEELTQDVFVQVLRARGRYRATSRLSTWLYRIATNLCLNEQRNRERRSRVEVAREGEAEQEQSAAHWGSATPVPTAEQAAAARELERKLAAAIQALPPKQRAALLLSRIDGLAYRDVAKVVGCSEGAVKALLFRATSALREQLHEYLAEGKADAL